MEEKIKNCFQNVNENNQRILILRNNSKKVLDQKLRRIYLKNINFFRENNLDNLYEINDLIIKNEKIINELNENDKLIKLKNEFEIFYEKQINNNCLEFNNKIIYFEDNKISENLFSSTIKRILNEMDDRFKIIKEELLNKKIKKK